MKTRLYGIPIIEDPNMVDAHSRVRTWRERLFSWPWRPWVKYLVWHTPKEDIYLVNLDGYGPRKQFICHPEMTRRVRDALKEDIYGRRT